MIISNDLVSRLIAQVCRDRRIEAVLHDLMDEAGEEVYFRPALAYARDDDVVEFDQLLRAAVRSGDVAIGYSEEHALTGQRSVVLNPSRRHRLRVHERLCLIVLAETE